MKKIVIGIFIALSIPTSLFAQDISVDELLGEGEEQQEQNLTESDIAEVEQERVENIENELNISIPEYTDNPSHIITFGDPSEEEVGVELDIDESGYTKIASPYSLPSLSIGKHSLKFRFVDSIGATKVLEYEIVVIPRPPILKAPTFEDGNLILSGTGLANSEAILTVSVGASNYTQIADIDEEGNWSTTVSFDTISGGIYTVFGYTRKNGYASNPSEPAVMEYGSKGIIRTSTGDNPISFSFKNLSFADLPTIISQNPDLLIAILSALILGIILTTLFFTLFNSNKEKRKEEEISKKINGQPKKEKTLMELFGQEQEKESKKETKKKRKGKKKSKKIDEVEKEPKTVKKDVVFTKKDFLKDFNKFDPDTDSGKEKVLPRKKDKKDVIVTLTSKIEE